MRMNYLARALQEAIREDEPQFKAAPRRRAGSLFAFLASAMMVVAILFLLVMDLELVRNPSTEMARASENALASSEALVQSALRGGQYAAGWASLLWNSMSDFEHSMQLLRTQPDWRATAKVAALRRQGADEMVNLLDRHGLLQLLLAGRTHDELAERIGRILDIDPSHVAETFREAQQDQIRALKEALDRHLSDTPGPSDLSQFSASGPARAASAQPAAASAPAQPAAASAPAQPAAASAPAQPAAASAPAQLAAASAPAQPAAASAPAQLAAASAPAQLAAASAPAQLAAAPAPAQLAAASAPAQLGASAAARVAASAAASSGAVAPGQFGASAPAAIGATAPARVSASALNQPGATTLVSH